MRPKVRKVTRSGTDPTVVFFEPKDSGSWIVEVLSLGSNPRIVIAVDSRYAWKVQEGNIVSVDGYFVTVIKSAGPNRFEASVSLDSTALRSRAKLARLAAENSRDGSSNN